MAASAIRARGISGVMHAAKAAEFLNEARPLPWPRAPPRSATGSHFAERWDRRASSIVYPRWRNQIVGAQARGRTREKTSIGIECRRFPLGGRLRGYWGRPGNHERRQGCCGSSSESSCFASPLQEGRSFIRSSSFSHWWPFGSFSQGGEGAAPPTDQARPRHASQTENKGPRARRKLHLGKEYSCPSGCGGP